jgi:predicted HTH transcriptional regulator
VLARRGDLQINQLRILDKIIQGQNRLDVNISQEEYLSVNDFVTQTPRGGYLSIKKHILQTSGIYEKDFTSKYSSRKSMRQIIIDFAKGEDQFTTSQIYDVFEGRSKDTIRQTLSQMTKAQIIERVSKGCYKLHNKDNYSQPT